MHARRLPLMLPTQTIPLQAGPCSCQSRRVSSIARGPLVRQQPARQSRVFQPSFLPSVCPRRPRGHQGISEA